MHRTSFSLTDIRGILIWWFCFGSSISYAQTYSLIYPEARRDSVVETYHGTQVNDPYRWMENLESGELQTWMHKQEELTDRYLDDDALISSLQDRISALRSFAAQGTPILRGNKTFVMKREAGQSSGKLYVASGNSKKERLLLDVESMREEGNTAYPTSYSPEGTWVTYAYAEGPSRWITTYILKVGDGSTAQETLSGFYGGRSNIAWLQDESGFFYSRYPLPDDPQAPLGTPEIYFHTIGTSQDEDRLIYRRPDDSAVSFTLRVTHDNDYLIISGSESGGTFNGLEDELLYLPLGNEAAQVRELFASESGQFAFEGNDGDQFLIRTSVNAPNLRLVKVDLHAQEKKQWKEIIPESDESMQSVFEIGDNLVVLHIKDSRNILRIYDKKGRQLHEIDRVTPSVYGLGDDRDRTYTYYGTSDLTDPGAIFRLDAKTGEESLQFRPDLPMNPEDYVTKQVFYTSKDGSRVPMFLVHKKELKEDGSNPVFMYAYGVWSWSAFPWQGHMIPWIEAGGIYAVANIRGGGEYGEAWHEAGMRLNKQNGIDDYIAAAEWLIDNNYTSQGLMIANGGSASGILPGAAIIQRPELFGAAVINFPTLDKIRYIHFGSAKSWIPEFGDPQNPDDFKALYAYSPYHNLEPGTCYPPTWIQVGENDDTTTPMHGYKFAAALQHAQGCNNPVLLKIARGAGHSYGRTPEQSRETQAQELAFLFKALNLQPSVQ